MGENVNQFAIFHCVSYFFIRAFLKSLKNRAHLPCVRLLVWLESTRTGAQDESSTKDLLECNNTKEVIQLVDSCYRQVKVVLDRARESDCGLMSLWQRFQEMAKKAAFVD